jgi:hypothetical protein
LAILFNSGSDDLNDGNTKCTDYDLLGMKIMGREARMARNTSDEGVQLAKADLSRPETRCAEGFA